MNSKRKILLSLFLMFVLAISTSLVSASETIDNQAISSIIDDDSNINDYLNSDDLVSSEIKVESDANENIQTNAENNDILTANNKKDLYVRVYGGQFKEGNNATLEISLLDKAEYYTEESVLSHTIKNVTVKVGENTYKLNIPKGAYEEDGYYLNLGNNLKSGNYSVIIEIPENSYYNAKTFTFDNRINIISEDNKANINIDKYDILPSDTFLGIDGYVYISLSGGVEDLYPTGNITVTLTDSKTTKEYNGTVGKYGEAYVKLGKDLEAGKYTIKVKYSGDNYHKPTSTVTAYRKFIIYNATNKIPVEYMSISIKNNTKGQKCIVKLNLKENKINNINMSGKALIIIKKNKKEIKRYKVDVNKNGKAIFSIGKKLVIGKYSISVKYYGSKYYNSFKKSRTFKITKRHLKFTNTTKKVKKSKARKARFKITLKSNYNKVLANKVIYLKINKKLYKAKTNKKGVAAFRLRLAKVKKTYKYKVTFKGDKSNYKKTYYAKLKVC